MSAILYVQIAALTGGVIGGALADRWMRTTPRGRIFTSAIGMVLFLPALFTVGHAGTLSMAITGLVALAGDFSTATTCRSSARSRAPSGGRRVTAS